MCERTEAGKLYRLELYIFDYEPPAWGHDRGQQPAFSTLQGLSLKVRKPGPGNLGLFRSFASEPSAGNGRARTFLQIRSSQRRSGWDSSSPRGSSPSRVGDRAVRRQNGWGAG